MIKIASYSITYCYSAILEASCVALLILKRLHISLY